MLRSDLLVVVVGVGVSVGEGLFMGFSVPEQMIDNHIMHGDLYKEGVTSEVCSPPLRRSALTRVTATIRRTSFITLE